jgi:hypothetical protein
MILHLLWGLVLWFSISKLGLGLSTDSVHLLFAGTNLSAGRGLVSFDGSPVLAWPPLYPLLLAFAHLATGLDTFAAAHVLQVVAFAGLSVCLSVLFLRIFPDDFALALAANVLSDIGVVVVASFDLVGSDYIHLFLVILSALLAGYYVEHSSGHAYLALFAVGMLAVLQRYLGIAAIATSVISILLLVRASLGQRLLRSLIMSLAALPAASWLVLTSLLLARREPISFTDNLNSFAQSVREWFLPPAHIGAQPQLYAALLGITLIAMIGVLYSARHTTALFFSTPVLLFGFFYVLVLFGSASIAFYNKLVGRFLLPLYIPFITLLLGLLQFLMKTLRRMPMVPQQSAMLVAFGLVGVVGGFLLRMSVPVILLSHAGASGAGENAFNTQEWRGNAALKFWRSDPPRGPYLLFSNEPDGVAFYTQHSSNASPRRYSGPYGTLEFPVEAYTEELFASGQDVYLVWIEPDARSYYYKPEDLSAIAEVEELYAGNGGAVYRLRLKPGIEPGQRRPGDPRAAGTRLRGN